MGFQIGDELIDSRDVIERIEELRHNCHGKDEAEELRDLLELAEEASGYAADWEYGETLIHRDYFVTYCQELAEDCGMVPKDLGWPCTCIDWEEAARQAEIDYTSVEIQGEEYLIR